MKYKWHTGNLSMGSLLTGPFYDNILRSQKTEGNGVALGWEGLVCGFAISCDGGGCWGGGLLEGEVQAFEAKCQ